MERDDSKTQEQPSSALSSLAQVAARTRSVERESKQDVSSTHKKRELPPRRPYRKTQNEMLSDASIVPKIDAGKQAEEEEAPCAPSGQMSTTVYQTNHGQYIAFTQGGAIQFAGSGAEGMQVMQPLTMSNTGAPQSAANIIQYSAQTGDGPQQYYMSGNKMVVPAATGDMSAYQLRTPTSSLPQGVVMAGSPSSLHSSQPGGDEATRKRELRLMKNRDAAKECRRRKREYVRCLETRLTMLEAQNKKLMDEIQYFKEMCGAESS